MSCLRLMLGIGQLRRQRCLGLPLVGAPGLTVALLVLTLALAVMTPPASGQGAGSAYATAVMADAPLAYWRLGDGGAGPLGDATGNGYSASVHGAVEAAGAALANDPDGAASFDASTGWAQADQALNVGPDVTLEAWVKASPTSSGPILAIDAGDQHAARMLYLENGHFWGRADLSAAWPSYSVASGQVDPSVWHHVAFVVQGGSSLSLYVDGALAGSRTTQPATTFTGTASLAWSSTHSWMNHFGGTIDEAAIYGAALSASSIAAHFQAGASPCAVSLQTRVDAAAPGSTVSVPGCVFRETVTVTKPLTLVGQPGAEIRGSDVWSTWTQSGSYWSAGPLPALPVYNDPSRCADQTGDRCLHAEQVFVDGKPQQWVAANPAPGQFAVDGQRNVLLATNPSGHTVEVTTRARWLVTASDHVSIQGFTMRDAANDAQTGALSNDGYSDWAIQDSTLTDAHGAVVAIQGGTNLRVQRNELARGGQAGLLGDSVTQVSIQGNHIHDNNTDGFDFVWAAGGAKLTQQHGVVMDANEVDHNAGPGLWSDVDSHDVTYAKNRVHDNRGAGIMFEISDGASIHDNAAWNNGWATPTWGWGAGILISTAANADVASNTLAWNAAGISVIEQRRSDAGATKNVSVHDNLVASTDGPPALSWLSEYGALFDPSANNQGANNRYWYPDDEGAQSRFAWRAGWIKRIAELTATRGDTGGKYISTPDKDNALSATSIPSSPPPH